MRKSVVFFLLSLLLLGGCENGNMFSWTHSRGKDDSVDALSADGSKALADGDYEDAIEYYEKILEKDSDNSEALYGLAAAQMKSVGLDLGALLPKFLNEEDPASNASAGTRMTGSYRINSALDDLLENLDYGELRDATKIAIDMLKDIVRGRADGVIPADDIDVNINMAVARVIHAVAYLLDKYPKLVIDEDFNVSGLKSIRKSDIDYVIGIIDDAINENLGVILRYTDIDIDDIKSQFKEFKAELKKLY
ncbi:MAG: tetratricopeptide repeat protein [Elusimicrobia bacterium]|nr:tetratricopeptide repeat protein [Elusimicrobiota bacterium]